MRTYRKELHFCMKSKRKLMNITREIEHCVKESRIEDGLILINAMSTTASVFINDADEGLWEDFEEWLEELAPEQPDAAYHHKGMRENADAHLKRSIMGRETVVSITRGNLDFGIWEQIFYYEFDGERDKRVLLKIIGN